MRDNHEKLPELLDAYERDGHFFGVVAVTIDHATRAFEIGLTPPAYKAFKAITNRRPFDTLPGLKYRYFFVPSVGGDPQSQIRKTVIRVELGKKGKQFEIEAPIDLIQNLIWFVELKTFEPADHLKRITQQTRFSEPGHGALVDNRRSVAPGR